MKKLVLFLSFISSVFAGQSGSYMGVGMGYGSLKVDDTVNLNRESSGLTGSIALGNTYGEYGRIYAVGMYRGASNGYENAGSVSLAYDFLVPVVDDIFSVYLGPVAGYTGYNANGLDLSGVHYGLEGGLIYTVNETFELEVGVRALKEKGSEDAFTAERSVTAFGQVNFYFESEKYFRYNN